MSFDGPWQYVVRLMSLNPFRSGQCLSTFIINKGILIPFVSIPFDQGNVFRRERWKYNLAEVSLNPFRSGQCLSTINR